jgi:hypothetical protein
MGEEGLAVEKETGVIFAVSQKPDKNGKLYKSFALGKDNWFNDFKNFTYEKGDTVNVEFVRNGDFKNVRNVTVKEKNSEKIQECDTRVPFSQKQKAKLKILAGFEIDSLEIAYNNFGENHQIIASKPFRKEEGIYDMFIWFI